MGLEEEVAIIQGHWSTPEQQKVITGARGLSVAATAARGQGSHVNILHVSLSQVPGWPLGAVVPPPVLAPNTMVRPLLQDGEATTCDHACSMCVFVCDVAYLSRPNEVAQLGDGDGLRMDLDKEMATRVLTKLTCLTSHRLNTGTPSGGVS